MALHRAREPDLRGARLLVPAAIASPARREAVRPDRDRLRGEEHVSNDIRYAERDGRFRCAGVLRPLPPPRRRRYDGPVQHDRRVLLRAVRDLGQAARPARRRQGAHNRDDEAVYPEWHSGTGKVPRDAWKTWEEDYKVTYPEYVAVQTEKETSAYAVKAALQRSTAFDHLDEGWKSATKMHFGGVALVEYAAVLAELKMARFGLSPAWRNMAVFGQLDELRHAQIT